MTDHARNRIRQRKISYDVVQLVLDEGRALTQNSNRLLLTRKHLRILKTRGQVDERIFQRAEKALPLVAVVHHGELVTVFRPTRRIDRRRTTPRQRNTNRRERWLGSSRVAIGGLK